MKKLQIIMMALTVIVLISAAIVLKTETAQANILRCINVTCPGDCFHSPGYTCSDQCTDPNGIKRYILPPCDYPSAPDPYPCDHPGQSAWCTF